MENTAVSDIKEAIVKRCLTLAQNKATFTKRNNHDDGAAIILNT